ncbi:MAG TPA: carboxypeptidase regulatory-like domain-containing protein [Opitutaceae bacterium]|nr:carboxypeptidase regulatory-like domain-containing protein [Opitutaceae bacterium]
MQKTFLRCVRIAGVAALAFLFGTPVFAQGVTTSGLNGFVTDKAGQPVAGAVVTVLHEPSGTRAVTATRPNGQYTLSGLRVGGPYTVTVEGKEFQPQSQKDIYLDINQDQTLNFAVTNEVVKMETFVVAGTRDTTFDTTRMSTNMLFSTEDINSIASIRRDVQDVALLDSRLSLTENTTNVEFSIAAQGQNSRFNSFLIDGVQSNDPFGLNANGFASLRSPVPLNFLASLSIDLSPYDVTRTGFTGALINAVVKSGTNEFHGSVYGYYTGKHLRGKNPVNQQHDQLQERTKGASFSGPIIKNRLFFFVGWEDFKRIQAAPGQTFVPDPTVVAQILAAAKAYGYDPGTVGASNSISTQKTYIAKIDWNISQKQRATFSYRRTQSGTPSFADFSGTTYTSFSNHWYQAQRINDVYSVQVNSQWTPNLRTDAVAQYSKYNGTASPYGAPFAEIYVNNVPGVRLDTGASIVGQIDMGTNYSYQLNNLFTKNYHGQLYGEYSLGSHTLKFGGDSDKNQYDDKFVQYYFGRWAFSSPTAFAAGTPNYLQYQQAAPGYTLPQGYAYYSMTDYGLLAQDTWRPTMNLTVMAGLRFDYPWFPGKPPFNGNFYNAFGFANNTTATGNYTVAPRVGVNYTLPKSFLSKVLGGRKTQLRGGFGLFQGTNPAVWVANSYQTAGVLNSVSYGSSAASTSNAPITQLTQPAFNPNPTYVQTLPPPGTPTATINVTDPNFKTPTSWKANIGIDHTLPWWGLVATAEANFIKVAEGIDYRNLNINPSGALPDGRTRYSGKIFSSFSNVLELLNTNKGGSQSYTIGVNRPMKDKWMFSAYYTHTHATEVQPLTSSVATSNFNYRSTIDPNAGQAVPSAYTVPDRLVISATRDFNFFHRKGTETRFTAVLRIQTGHAYSWIFQNDANGDGTTGNDAFYVPTPTDTRVTWAATNFASATAAHDAFFNWLNGTDLIKRIGSIAPPNSSFNPEQQTIDLHVEQHIPLPYTNKVRLSVFWDCLNFANLLNDRWGAITGLDFGTGFNGYNRSTGVTATYVASTNTYTYAWNPTQVSAQPAFTDLSRWQMQIGAKLEF